MHKIFSLSRLQDMPLNHGLEIPSRLRQHATYPETRQGRKERHTSQQHNEAAVQCLGMTS